MAKSEKREFEIEVLNADGLDVEELEKRIEMSAAVPAQMGWTCDCDGVCTCFGACGVDSCPYLCDVLCTTDCGSDCPYLCSVDCSTDTCMILAPEEPV